MEYDRALRNRRNAEPLDSSRREAGPATLACFARRFFQGPARLERLNNAAYRFTSIDQPKSHKQLGGGLAAVDVGRPSPVPWLGVPPRPSTAPRPADLSSDSPPSRLACEYVGGSEKMDPESDPTNLDVGPDGIVFMYIQL